ncbi:hypothetical protein CRG98_008886 [Punica granatum]|uniref:Uncharacterized protein n=1 Tax=Punica granatum TaxID=22663 RepID=A0A2I0KQR7_PUNGR|nr:hypothetical protein CRG98_008886 [Punica granatum]
MGRGPLADGRSGSPGTAATTLRAAVLALGRPDFSRFWRKSRKSAIWRFWAGGDRGQPVSAAQPA